MTPSRLPLLLAAALVALPVSAAHADPPPVTLTAEDGSFALQGSVTYDCLGCGSTATFQGVTTFVRDGVPSTVPATGELTVQESCDGATGSAYGTLHVGADDYQVSWTRAVAAVVVTAFGPGGAFRVEAGPGTLTFDAPPGTCGIPVTATLTAALAAADNCACVIAGDHG